MPNALPGALALGGPVGRLAGLRALVVDDDPVARRVTAALLERLGCAVDASAGAAEGAAATHLYDLLVLDLRLADGDGLDCAAAVWEDDRRRGISATPAVVLTASACAETRARCAAAGVGACVEKPAGAVALGEAACDALARGALDPGALAALRALAADAPDDPLLARVAADYARQATRHLRALDAAIAAGDTDGVERAAHVLRGASASAGARRAALAAAALTAGGAPPLLVDAARLRTLVTAAARALAAAAADRA